MSELLGALTRRDTKAQPDMSENPQFELYCEQCGKGYDKGDSDADSRADFCSKVCEDAYWAKLAGSA